MFGGESGGGGFPSPGGGGGFGSPGNAAKTKQRVQNLVPCTIGQIRTATKEDDQFYIGTMPLGQVEVFGMITDVSENSTAVTYMLNDLTGEDMQVKHWLEEADDEAEARASQILKRGQYVRVCGNVRDLAGTRGLIGFRIFPINDMNEFSCHALEVIHSQMLHKYMKSGAGGSIAANGAMDTSVNGAGPSNGPSHDAGYSPDFSPAPVPGLQTLQHRVLQAIQMDRTESGPHVKQVMRSIGSTDEQAVRNAIDFLSNEGHIYSTTDDDHHKATDSAE